MSVNTEELRVTETKKSTEYLCNNNNEPITYFIRNNH